MAIPFSLGNFYGIDSLIDFIIASVAILVASQSYKAYRITEDKNFKFFSWAFISISIGYLSKILANLTIIHNLKILDLNLIPFILEEFNELNYIHFISFAFYKFFVIFGFLTLFLIAGKKSRREDIFVLMYLGVIVILFSVYFDLIFYLTLEIILIILAIHFRSNFKRKKSNQSLATYSAFIVILLGNIFNALYPYGSPLYLTGEVIIFIGFSIILLNHIKIKNE